MPEFEVTFGSRAFLPFRAAITSDGASSDSPASYIQIDEPNSNEGLRGPRELAINPEPADFLQISPFNFGLFMNPVSLDNNGTYTISLVDIGILAKRNVLLFESATVNVIVNCKALKFNSTMYT